MWIVRDIPKTAPPNSAGCSLRLRTARFSFCGSLADQYTPPNTAQHQCAQLNLPTDVSKQRLHRITLKQRQDCSPSQTTRWYHFSTNDHTVLSIKRLPECITSQTTIMLYQQFKKKKLLKHKSDCIINKQLPDYITSPPTIRLFTLQQRSDCITSPIMTKLYHFSSND